MDDINLLVISCDAYRDLWRPFFTLLFRRWPDCPFRVVLGSNEARFDDPRVTPLPVGKDGGWGANVLTMLTRLTGTHVITLLDDFLLESPVNTAVVNRLMGVAMREEVDCLRLIPNPGPTQPVNGYAELGEMGRHDPYRISTQAAIWRREALARLVRPDYSPWQFELDNSRIAADGLRIWGVYRPVLKYRHGVERGRWLPQGLKICRDAHVAVDRRSRPAMTRWEVLARHGQVLRGLFSRLYYVTCQRTRSRMIRGVLPAPRVRSH
jgi:hypothetical protein